LRNVLALLAGLRPHRVGIPTLKLRQAGDGHPDKRGNVIAGHSKRIHMLLAAVVRGRADAGLDHQRDQQIDPVEVEGQDPIVS
jgi:hypothetical protein